MNHLLHKPNLPQIMDIGTRATIDSVRDFIKNMKKQGIPSRTLTTRDYQNSLILRRAR